MDAILMHFHDKVKIKIDECMDVSIELREETSAVTL